MIGAKRFQAERRMSSQRSPDQPVERPITASGNSFASGRYLSQAPESR